MLKTGLSLARFQQTLNQIMPLHLPLIFTRKSPLLGLSLTYWSQKTLQKCFIEPDTIFMNSGTSLVNYLLSNSNVILTSYNITQIDTPTGPSIDPLTINNQFKNFYSLLYTSEGNPASSIFESFFQTLDVPFRLNLTRRQIWRKPSQLRN